jgi:membrane-bound inhibitor of C-type lysozyme
LKLDLLLFTTLAVLSASPSAAKSPHRYRCDDGTRLIASFVGVSSPVSRVVVTFDSSKAQVLPQIQSADGGRYSDGKTEFWIKGKGATLTRPNKPATRCSTPST